ncbi:RNA polymerase sigma-70 factor [Parelusimicrobium proximum]|uniref:RNA polymerase sigma factor n=1 Tax=Parelusimicrobium proximum TaxID=3228953 RepID=UPI003D174017
MGGEKAEGAVKECNKMAVNTFYKYANKRSYHMDAKMLQEYREGNLESLEMLVKKYQDILYTYALSLLKDESTAADVVQDVFLKIVERPDSFKEGNLKSWLFTVTRNKCMDIFRLNSKGSISLDEKDEDGLSLEDKIAGADPAPLEKMLSASGNEMLYKVFDTLPADQKEVITLRAEFSFKEIAEMLKCPLGTVLARASRGYKKMRCELEAGYEG